MSNIVAIIAARGGSKGIPDKNIRDFCGKPLLAWSIIQAGEVDEIDSVWVSSDSDKILSVAAEFGAKTIKRPQSLSTDRCSSESAWLHALDIIQEKSSVDVCVALQATSPLREPHDIAKALNTFHQHNYDSLFSAAELEDFLIWRREKGRLQSLNYDFQNRGIRQERQSDYVENGSFYIFTPDILSRGNRLAGNIGMYLMDYWKSFEIDTIDDLALCETFFRHHKLSSCLRAVEHNDVFSISE